MIGHVGEVIGSTGVNIDFMHIGRSPEGKGAMMVVTTAEAVPAQLIGKIEALEGVLSVSSVEAR